MILQRSLLAVSLSAAIATLVACGGSGAASSGATASTTSGTLFDGAVAGATVFCDTDGSGTLTGSEQTAVTGDDGKFTFATACTADVVSKEGTGVDVTTNQAPRGSFRAVRGSLYVTPFTTMLAHSGLTLVEFQAVMNSLGLGSVDPGTFNPAVDNATLRKAMAAAKVLNDLAAIVSAAGGDPAAAFKAAAAALATAVKNNPGDLSADDTKLNAVLDAASAAAFANSGAFANATQKANAAKLAREAIKLSYKAIRSAADNKAAEDAFGNESSSDTINKCKGDGTLDDDTKTNTKSDEIKNDQNIAKAQYLAIDSVGLFSSPSATTPTLLTADALASTAGATVTGMTLATIDRLQLNTHAQGTPLGSSGKTVQLAVEVTQTGSSRTLKFQIDKVQLGQTGAGNLEMVVKAGAKLNYYAKSGARVELFPAKAIENLSPNVLSTANGGPVLNFATIIGAVSGDLGNNTTNQALLQDLLGSQGTFKVKVIVTDVDLREAIVSGNSTVDTKLASGKISIPKPGDTTKTDDVRGALFDANLTFN
ncbi:MAG: hypothetical protein RIQ60_1264 [Pseudomonadota bacterium]|jgi:hypothetical protein